MTHYEVTALAHANTPHIDGGTRGIIYALLAVADAIHDSKRPPAGTCTAVLRTEYFPGDAATHSCRHPHGHTGAHQDFRRTNTWMDNATGAMRISDTT